MDYDCPYIGKNIIPTDELIFFRGVGIPSTSITMQICMFGICWASLWRRHCQLKKHHPQQALLQPPHCDLSCYLHHVFTCKQGKEDPQPLRQASFGSKRQRCRILAFTCGLHTRRMGRHWKLITVIICVPWYFTSFQCVKCIVTLLLKTAFHAEKHTHLGMT